MLKNWPQLPNANQIKSHKWSCLSTDDDEACRQAFDCKPQCMRHGRSDISGERSFDIET